MMDKILAVLAYAGEIKVRYDDDSVDRLNRTYTTFILVVSLNTVIAFCTKNLFSHVIVPNCKINLVPA